LRQSETVPLKQLLDERYGTIMCYPRYDLMELRRRIKELKKLGVTAVEFAGDKNLFNVSVLGKGYVGVVVIVFTDQGKVALKVRRVDADRTGMQHEAEMLRKANVCWIPPKTFSSWNSLTERYFHSGLKHWRERKQNLEFEKFCEPFWNNAGD